MVPTPPQPKKQRLRERILEALGVLGRECGEKSNYLCAPLDEAA